MGRSRAHHGVTTLADLPSDETYGAWLSRQRDRVRVGSNRIYARYLKRIKALDLPNDQPTLTCHGVRQTWHRGATDQQRGYEG